MIMTQENKVSAALEAYKAATQELYRTGEIFDSLCEKEFGKNAGDYRYIREYHTPEIKAAAKAFDDAAKEFHRTAQAYRDAEKEFNRARTITLRRQ